MINLNKEHKGMLIGGIKGVYGERSSTSKGCLEYYALFKVCFELETNCLNNK